MADAVYTGSMMSVALQINGQLWRGDVRAEETLLEFVRERLRLTGTKRSCESQVCGACTVLVDGEPISACTYLTFEASGKCVTTRSEERRVGKSGDCGGAGRNEKRT